MAGAAFDPDNRLCAWNSATASCSSPAITWDANGNLLNDGTLKYTWDARNRLKTTSNSKERQFPYRKIRGNDIRSSRSVAPHPQSSSSTMSSFANKPSFLR